MRERDSSAAVLSTRLQDHHQISIFPPFQNALCSALLFSFLGCCLPQTFKFHPDGGPTWSKQQYLGTRFFFLLSPARFVAATAAGPVSLLHVGRAFFASLFTIRRNRHRRPSISPELALDHVEDSDNSISVTHLGAIQSFDQLAHNTIRAPVCDNSPSVPGSYQGSTGDF